MEYKKSEASDSGEFLNKMELDEEQWQSIGYTWYGSVKGKVFLGPIPDSVLSNKEYDAHIKKMDEYFKNGGSFTQEPMKLDVKKLDQYVKQYGGNKPSKEVTMSDVEGFMKEWEKKHSKLSTWKDELLGGTSLHQQIESWQAAPSYEFTAVPDSVVTTYGPSTPCEINFTNPPLTVAVEYANSGLVQDLFASQSAKLHGINLRVEADQVWILEFGEWAYLGELVGGFLSGAAKSGPSVMSPINQLRAANAEGFEKEVRCPGNYVKGNVIGLEEVTDEPCPAKASLWNMVQHLNDLHKWTREQIADWIEDSGNNFDIEAPDE